MTLLEQLSLPAVIFAVIVVLVVAVTFSRGGRAASRDTAHVIASVQAERDVLRAHHAVEVATLEGRLSDAMIRTEGVGDAAFRLKAAEAAVESARSEAAAQKSARMQLSERVANLTAERDQFAAGTRQAAHQLLAEREHAHAEIAAREERIAALQADLDALSTASGADGDEPGPTGEERAAAAVSLDAARAEAARQEQRADEAERAIAELRQHLAAAAEAGATAGGNVDQAAFQRAIAERDETIAALRASAADAHPAAVEVDADSAGSGQLARALEAAEARERDANVSLSRLAYDRDGLANRIATLERAESEARASAMKHEALNELRQQKIYELEARLREQGTELSGTRQQLAAAEANLAEGRSARVAISDADQSHAPGDAEEVQRLNATLGRISEENAALVGELEAMRLRAISDGDGATLSTSSTPSTRSDPDGSVTIAADAQGQELATVRQRLAATESENAGLAAENARLVAEATGRIDHAEAELLRTQLRQLAERFAAEAEAAPTPAAAEPTLAERIRQFREKQRAAAANGSA